MALSDQWQRQFFNLSGRTALGMGAQGAGDLAAASRFEKTLLGGDRTALERQFAPSANAAQASQDAALRQQSQTDPRTGGNVAANAATQDKLRQTQQAGILGEQGNAPQTLQGISQTALNTMMNSMGIGLTAVQSDINSRRAAHAQMWSSLIGGAGALAGGGLAGGAFKGLLGGAAKATTPAWQGPPTPQPEWNANPQPPLQMLSPLNQTPQNLSWPSVLNPAQTSQYPQWAYGTLFQNVPR